MTDDFATDGALAQAIKGFKPREAQRQMAEAVTEAINFKQELVVEAGTGTGKTYAYLVPALRADRKVIISTGSKALQDQLYARDLPTVAKALKYKGKMALLKGRSNDLCLERLEQQSMAGGELAGQALIDLVHLHTRTHPHRRAQEPERLPSASASHTETERDRDREAEAQRGSTHSSW